MAIFPGSKLKQELKQLQVATQQLTRQVSFQNAFKFINDSIALYPDWGVLDYANSYISTDQVFSVVNLICETGLKIPKYVYIEKQDNESKRLINEIKLKTTAHFHTTKSLHDIKRLQIKALQDAPENDPFLELLKTPNDKMSADDFILACLIFYQLKECFIYKNRIPNDEFGGANAGKVAELIPIPPQNVVIRVSSQPPNYIVGYDIRINGITVIENLSPEDIIHWKRFNPCTWDSTNAYHRGLSPLEPLKRVITRLKAEDDVTTAQLQNGGLPGIIYDDIGPENYNKTTQEVIDQKREVFWKFQRENENKGLPWLTGGKLGYIQTGLKLADMLVAELGKADFKRICNAYKVSDVLFNNGEASTESNVEIQTKRLYTNASLPLVYSFYNALVNGLKDDFPDKKRIILPDATSIPELQDDFKKMAEGYSSLPGGFSSNELREAFGWDKSTEPDAERLLIKSGYVFLDEMGAEPIAQL